MPAACVCVTWWRRRAVNELVEVEAAAKEDRQRALEAAAENRILSAALRCVQDECQACKVSCRMANTYDLQFYSSCIRRSIRYLLYTSFSLGRSYSQACNEACNSVPKIRLEMYLFVLRPAEGLTMCRRISVLWRARSLVWWTPLHNYSRRWPACR